MFQINVIYKIKTSILYSTTFSENQVVYEDVQNLGKSDRTRDNITRRMRTVYYIIKTRIQTQNK
jgi:hypothetical protein